MNHPYQDHDFLYWLSWSKRSRFFTISLLSIFLLLCFTFLISYFNTDRNIYPLEWKSTTEAIPIKQNINAFGVSFSYDTDNFINFAEIEAHEKQSNPLLWNLIGYFWLFLITIALTIISYWRGIPLYLGQATIGAWFFYSNLDQSLIFGSINNWLFVICIGSLLGLTNYFSLWRPTALWWQRWLSYILVTGLIICLVFGFAEESNLVFRFAQAGLFIPIIISIFFIIQIAWEIPLIFLKYSNNLVQFTGLIMLYLGSLLLLFFIHNGSISKPLFVVDTFLFLVVGILFGISGFRNRANETLKWIRFKPFGLWLYLVLASLLFSLLTLFSQTGNDVMLEVFEDSIVYTHFAFGIVFYVYAMGNFSTLIHNGIPVWKVFYRPNRIPLFTFILGGIIGSAAFVLTSNMLVIDQAVSGFYNTEGDMYKNMQEDVLSKASYNYSQFYGYNNHHANYQLGHLLQTEGLLENAKKKFESATKKNPSVASYIALSSINHLENNELIATFVLQEGLKKYEFHPSIRNNLGLLYNQLGVSDSAFYYLEPSEFDADSVKEIMKINQLSSLIFQWSKDQIEFNEQLFSNNFRTDFIDQLDSTHFMKELLLMKNLSFEKEKDNKSRGAEATKIKKAKRILLGTLAQLESFEHDSVFSSNMFVQLLHAITYARKVGVEYEPVLVNRVDQLYSIDETIKLYVDKELGLWALDQQYFRDSFDRFSSIHKSGYSELQSRALEALTYIALRVNSPHLALTYLREIPSMQNLDIRKAKIVALTMAGEKDLAKEWLSIYQSDFERQEDSLSVGFLKLFIEKREPISWYEEGKINGLIDLKGGNENSKVNPFNISTINQVMTVLFEKGQFEEAYAFILDIVGYNPYNNELNLWYIKAALKTNLLSFAESEFDTLKNRLNISDRAEIERLIAQVRLE